MTNFSFKAKSIVSDQRKSSVLLKILTLFRFHREKYLDDFLVLGTTRHCQLLGLPLQGFQKLPQKLGTESYSKGIARNFCRSISSQPTALFCKSCWNDSACSLLKLPLPQCFCRVCLPILFAAVLKLFLPLTISTFSGATKSNKSAPRCFEAETIFLRKKRIEVLPIICANAPKTRTRCRPTLL